MLSDNIMLADNMLSDNMLSDFFENFTHSELQLNSFALDAKLNEFLKTNIRGRE
jgi:hypothetical protein